MNDTTTPRERFRKTLDISTGVSELLADSNASYIHWLEKELVEANEYADRLVEHKDMVCLPADLANLRAANAHFAIENEALKKEIKDLRDLLMFGK